MEQEYKNDFEKFLAHTDEKKVLLDEILKDVERHQTQSLLDIGAGNGLLAIPLAQKVSRYIAIESNSKFAEKLSALGIEVIKENFPTPLTQQFDMVLSSHSISYKPEYFAPFINSAFGAVAPGGVLLIITYRGQEDDWCDLLKALGDEQTDHNRVGFNAIIELAHTLGDVTSRKVTTTVQTNNMEDMLEALSFVYSGGRPEKKEFFFTKKPILEKLLNSRYKHEDGYSFPFQHFFIKTKK